MRAWPFVLFFCFAVRGHECCGRLSSERLKQLHDLFAAAWDYEMQQRPEEASELGDRRWNDRWTDMSLEAYARRDQHNQEVLAQLAKIDRSS